MAGREPNDVGSRCIMGKTHEIDYLRYYNLESFLFEDVSNRFREHGSIDAFDFFSIVIWKANRAKSVTAKRLRTFAEPGESLDAVCRRLTGQLHDAMDDEAQFMILQDWGFALPMASAILTVLRPDRFTVYDYRVCEELGSFESLVNLSNRQRLWEGYSKFIEAVRAMALEGELRDTDRHLIARSLANQLRRDIDAWFEPRATRIS
jgi:hypothetical protein